MPDFVGQPPTPLRGEHQPRPVSRRTGKQTVARGDGGIQFVFRDAASSVVKDFDILHSVDGERAQGILAFIPAVEIPLVAVLDQALRRHNALRHRACGKAGVYERELLPPDQGGCRRDKPRLGNGSRMGAQDTHSVHGKPLPPGHFRIQNLSQPRP